MRFALLLATAALMTGCTTTRTLDPSVSALRSDVNERAARHPAVVTLASGERVPAASLHLAPDVTTWLDPTTGQGRSVETEAIVSIRITDRGRGTLQGAGAGLSVAAVAAGVALAAYPTNDWVTNSDAALLVGVGTGVPLATAGAIVGTARRARTDYVRPEAETP